MSEPHHRQRRRQLPWGRLLLLAVFLAAAVFAGYHCLFRAPEQKQPDPEPLPQEEVPALSPEEEAAAEALRSHMERKPDFYTILLSGVDDHNGGSDTNILVAVDAANDAIYGVSIPRDTKAIINGKAHKIN